jgi:hypothetical protein
MRTISEVKEYLDGLREREQSPVIARTLHLPDSQMTEADCQFIEEELDIELPESYRRFLLLYDWADLRLAYLEFFASADTIIESNLPPANPFYAFNRENGLLEIGSYEADPICIRIQENNGQPTGQVVCLNHESYPEFEVRFVSGDVERLVVCAAIDLQLKKEVDYYGWSDDQKLEDEEALFNQIMDAILEVEPRARETSFWYGFVRGF